MADPGLPVVGAERYQDPAREWGGAHAGNGL